MAVIDVHSFGFTYPGAQRPAVRDVAFSVEPGEIFRISGPERCRQEHNPEGFDSAAGWLRGQVSLCWGLRDLRAWNRGYYRRIGVAFEAPNHYLKLTAREKLQLFAGLHGGATEDLRLY